MASGRAVRAMVGGAAALALVAGLYVLVRPQVDEPGEALPTAARAVEPAPAPMELPAAPAAAAEPLSSAGNSGGEADGLAGPDSPSRPRTLADIGHRPSR